MSETPSAAKDAAKIARLITESLNGRRWVEMTPLAIAEHLVANGVRCES